MLCFAEDKPVLPRRGGLSERGDACKRCGGYRESLRHVFVCDDQVTRAIRHLCTSRCVDILREARIPTYRSATMSLVPEPAKGGGYTVWSRVWFDLSDTLWMQTWSARKPTALRWPRDRYGDIIGVLPQGLNSVLDRYWNGEAWVRRQLGDTPVIMEAIRAELMEADVH